MKSRASPAGWSEAPARPARPSTLDSAMPNRVIRPRPADDTHGWVPARAATPHRIDAAGAGAAAGTPGSFGRSTGAATGRGATLEVRTCGAGFGAALGAATTRAGAGRGAACRTAVRGAT